MKKENKMAQNRQKQCHEKPTPLRMYTDQLEALEEAKKHLESLLQKIRDGVCRTDMEWLQLCSKVEQPQEMTASEAMDRPQFKDTNDINATPLTLDIPLRGPEAGSLSDEDV